MTRAVGKIRILILVMVWALTLPGGLHTSFAQEAPDRADAVTLEAGASVEREIGSGDVHAYQIPVATGEFLRVVVHQRGIDVVVTFTGPSGQEIAEVDTTGAEGGEAVEVAATTSGFYRLEIRPYVEGVEPPEPGRYEIRIDEHLSAQQYAELLAAERANRESVKRWLADHAIPLRTVETGHGFADMQPIKDIVGDARLVALGEATHGSREFFQLKHRMLEFLVNEMGFTVFGIEASMPEAFDINEYVLTGRGDPAKALTGLGFWIWNTEEVLDLIEWMRRYNQDPRHSQKVKFYGFDLQFAPHAARVTLDYLRTVDPVATLAIDRQLEVLANPYTSRKFLDWSKEQQEQTAAAIRSVLRRLDDNRAKYVSRTDSTAWALGRQHARVVAQFVKRMSTIAKPDGWMVRDSAMAENIRWILEQEGPEAKMVVCAWNGHVSTGAGSMGAHLREAFGKDMVVFGFAFNQGSFQAIETPMPSTAGLRVFTVGPAREGSLDATLAAAGLRLAAVDLRKLPQEGPVAEWWDAPHETRNLGASYGEDRAAAVWRSRTVTQLYDALLFVESTTAAHPNPGGRVVGRALLGAPANLDFEGGELGEPPPGWLIGLYPGGAFDEVIATFRDFDFDLTTSGDRPYRGQRSAMIARPPGRHYGDAYGLLGQRIEAAPYRGKRVRLRAAVRTEVSGPGNQAYLWLRVTKAWAFPPSTVFHEDMSDRPIKNREWQEYEIVGEVPEDAEMIDYGLALVGDGRAWIDAVSVEVDEEGRRLN